MSGFQSDPSSPFQRITIDGTYAPRVSTYTYNVDGSLATETEPNGLVLTYAYNGDGTLHTITTSAGNVTTFSYDGSGNLTGQSVI